MCVVAGHSNDHAVGGTSALNLHPLALTRQVASVVPLGDDPFDTRQEPEPVFGLPDVICLRNELQIRLLILQQALEAGAPIPKGPARHFHACRAQNIEDEQQCPRLSRFVVRSASASTEALLQRAEVGVAVRIGDHDLAINDAVQRQSIRRADEFGK